MAVETAPRVLVLEDEPAIREIVVRALTFAGYDVTAVGTTAQAREALTRAPAPDLLLLDVMLPEGSGFEVGAHARAHHPGVAVVFLTAKDSVDDRLTGFALGGDDYLTKPFHIAELVARVGAVLRRAQPPATEPQLQVADLVIREHAHEVTRAGARIDLSPTEYRLLEHLVRNAGRVLSKQQLLEAIWQYDFGGDAGVVEKFVSQLRRKVDTGHDPLLHTVRGFGYVVRPPES
ncbi:response regulator transcription factor [Spongisporangium articulatum]|uniref:Response regulator transcription factor n=1 Tax=Spongisporangium articulatum TaxID=3362603 RepID=A0ABW8ASI4_9ACTN